ncbi:MAG TPA: thioredoxin family protein [Candidatus Mcinerneyibacteriales bacterium]|jgi:small redox-active disulfide protein 2|nr:thioredoxin family protein [Candidatus Mcinerneyibacteriales bacterium]
MIIKILGTGCPKCKKLEEQARLAVEEAGVDAEIVKVSDIDAIMEMGVMMTPALAIDDDVKISGRLASKDEIVKLIKG